MSDTDELQHSEEYEALKAQLDELTAEMQNEEKQKNELETFLRDLEEKRRRLANDALNLQGNIRVFCRVRPFGDKERQERCVFTHLDAGYEKLQDSQLILLDDSYGVTTKTYEFNRVFDEMSTQEQIFEKFKPLVTSVLDGFNVCIFAYGQTASGKTYTMNGTEKEPGIIPRTIQRLTQEVERRGTEKYTITFSMLEIYNETVRDLLDVSKINLEIKNDDGKMYVKGLTKRLIDQFQTSWGIAQQNRHVGGTNQNDNSSRSHFLICIYVNDKTTENESKMYLIDLAGSERLNQTGATGDRRKEAANINKSLSQLRLVLETVANNPQSSFVPYRDSKLTFLLQDSLCVNDSKTLMLVQVSPAVENLQTTKSSLNFAETAAKVEISKNVNKLAAV